MKKKHRHYWTTHYTLDRLKFTSTNYGESAKDAEEGLRESLTQSKKEGYCGDFTIHHTVPAL